MVHRLAIRRQVCTLTGSAVAPLREGLRQHGRNPQDRADSPIARIILALSVYWIPPPTKATI
ncbi:hypothetical protein A0J48_014060 [Sphaerospermopsis aphanizomenoides BCCUSP55]|uniref:hypothetical protein n=1 Tax=Sphaerospermopsis aphanizomenoides TaxID=459663 RepID=UPI0019041259|nr:hypothetical protein [Sphaerospermopsis aphanizomenoides]MBK1988650.1 hypothetical protein [Sphaerospermopsis aphanizomenoides BCCUSP55]